MRIAIPVDDNFIETKVCISFGRTPYFMIYDTESKQSSFIDNSAAASAGGAGIKAAQLVADNKIDVLLTMRCGENADNVLEPAGIKIYKALSGTAKSNIDKFLSGELSKLEEIHPGFHGHGG